MPKIPTFTARGRPTEETEGIKTGIQISPTSSIAAKILPAMDVISDYTINKRNNEEQLSADKIILELKSESDKIIFSQKDNIIEEDAINNYKQTFNPKVIQKISTIENIYHLKQNSFQALEKDSLTNVNNKITSLMGRYATTDNPILKIKYKVTTEDVIKKYSKDFNLPDNIRDQKLKAAKQDFLLADMNQFAGKINGAEEIKNLDNTLKGTNFLNDEDFGAGFFNAYNSKISELTIKGNPESDYERALDLVDELKNFKRSNGYKVDTGKISIQIDNLEQKVLNEKISHDSLLRKQGDNKIFYDYSSSLKTDLSQSIADPFGQPELEARLAATEIEDEFDRRIKQYISAYPDATLEEKKSYARSTTYVLKSKYEDNQILKISEFNLQATEIDILSKYNTTVDDMKKLSEGTLNQDIIESYESLARLNGYQDIQSFMNDYLPLLKAQLSEG